MATTSTTPPTAVPRRGAPCRVRLTDGRVLDGILARADHRVVRLRPAGGHALVVLYRHAVAGLDAA